MGQLKQEKKKKSRKDRNMLETYLLQFQISEMCVQFHPTILFTSFHQSSFKIQDNHAFFVSQLCFNAFTTVDHILLKQLYFDWLTQVAIDQ